MSRDERLRMIRERHEYLLAAGRVRRHTDNWDDGGFEDEQPPEFVPLPIDEDDEEDDW